MLCHRILLIVSPSVIIDITLTSFKQLHMLFKTLLRWFREKHNMISDPYQSLLLSFIKFLTLSYLHEKVYFGISEPHRKVWSYHKRPTSTENCGGRFMGSYFFMRVARARRRRAATLMKKYEPMIPSSTVFCGGMNRPELNGFLWSSVGNFIVFMILVFHNFMVLVKLVRVRKK